jgi:hypothetical protein
MNSELRISPRYLKKKTSYILATERVEHTICGMQVSYNTIFNIDYHRKMHSSNNYEEHNSGVRLQETTKSVKTARGNSVISDQFVKTVS